MEPDPDSFAVVMQKFYKTMSELGNEKEVTEIFSRLMEDDDVVNLYRALAHYFVRTPQDASLVLTTGIMLGMSKLLKRQRA